MQPCQLVAVYGGGIDVDLDVPATEFGLKGRIGDRGEHFAVAHRGGAGLIDEVEFDLQTGQRVLRSKQSA